MPSLQRIILSPPVVIKAGTGMNAGEGKDAQEGENKPSSSATTLPLPNEQVHVEYDPQNSAATEQPNDGMPQHQGQNNNAPTFIPSLERFSEFRIDQASSIDDLEYIRHRLVVLLDRVNARLIEKRETGAKTINEGGKSKRQCKPCPLCLEKPGLSSTLASTMGSCEICEESGLCNRCYVSCPSCHRSTCADCLFSCGDCGLRYHCSDCVIFGEGKCMECRELAKTGEKGATVGLQKGKKNQSHPQKSRPLPQSNMVPVAVAHPPKPLPPINASSANQAQTVYPSISEIQPNSRPMPSSQLYSIHRFIISDEGKIGIDVKSFTKGRRCIVANVITNSIAFNIGVQARDEIILPKSTTVEQNTHRDVYDLFLEAAKHRPLLLEVKRPYKFVPAPSNLKLDGPHALHRFVIAQAGSLGMSVSPRYPGLTIVSTIQPNSLGDLYGFCEDDIICNSYESFCISADSGERPWIVNVLRAVSTTIEGPRRRPIRRFCSVENPFTFKFPVKIKRRTDEHERKAVVDAGAVSIRKSDGHAERMVERSSNGKRSQCKEVERAAMNTEESKRICRPSSLLLEKPDVSPAAEASVSSCGISEELPSISVIKPNSIPTPSPQLYSIHRFIISNKGNIGIDVKSITQSRRCIVTNVNTNSVALNHGVEVNDEIILPEYTTFENTHRDVYDLFVEAAKHRPLLFEVKRPFKSTSVPTNLALDGPHSLHRFVITEPGSLGITIAKRCRCSTIVSAIQPNSLADMHGFCEDDIMCEPFESCLDMAKKGERPWIVHVWRAVSTTSEGVRRRPIQRGCPVENPFLFSFPVDGMVPMDESANNIQEGECSETDKPEGNVGSEIIVIDDEDE